jgi:hypothetical protein
MASCPAQRGREVTRRSRFVLLRTVFYNNSVSGHELSPPRFTTCFGCRSARSAANALATQGSRSARYARPVFDIFNFPVRGDQLPSTFVYALPQVDDQLPGFDIASFNVFFDLRLALRFSFSRTR